MTETALRFLASLTPAQNAQATFAFDDPERMHWSYVPMARQGLPFRDMLPYQRHLASALLAAGLSQTGYIKAVTIMSLEEVLRVLENASDDYRNPEKYYFSIFGMPSDQSIWGYRVEGHHVSQNYTLGNGRVVDAPSFFGANPAQVRDGARAGLRALAAEEDRGRELIAALDAGQRQVAIVDPAAYADILTASSRKAALEGQPSGLPAACMTTSQMDMLLSLIGEYTRNVPDVLAAAREEQVRAAGEQLYFAWAGSVNVGEPHYYRVQTPTFLIEYDNTQNGANHVHAVWRDFTGDFGGDLLLDHYDSSHRHAQPVPK